MKRFRALRKVGLTLTHLPATLLPLPSILLLQVPAHLRAPSRLHRAALPEKPLRQQTAASAQMDNRPDLHLHCRIIERFG